MVMNYVKGYAHIGIPTDDMEKTTEFFLKLGFKLKMETIHNGNPVRFFEGSGVEIETYIAGDGAANKPGAVDHIALAVEDLAGCVKLIKEEGFELREGPAYLPFWDHGYEYVTIYGPNREAIEFGKIFASDSDRDETLKATGVSM